MKERLKKELEIFLFIVIFLTITYLSFYFLNIIKHPSITGLVVYNIENRYNNYTFDNASLYSFNDSLINLSNGVRLKAAYSYYNITNEMNETITLVNITYPGSAIINTLDFSPQNLNSWNELIKNEILNGQNITYYYSTDLGENWTLIQDFNLSSINSTKIRLRINLISNTTETPVVSYLTLKYLINVACIENWQCTEWTNCYINGTQTRTCTDNNACGSEDNKPALIQNCTYSCLSNWIEVYKNCLINNTKLKYYNDTTSCNNISNLPNDNNSYVSCDYCTTNWTCSLYGGCIDEEKECLNVTDNNNCYNTTNLTSDTYTGDYSEFTVSCNEITNVTSSSAESAESEGGGEAAAAGGEAGESGEAESEEIKLESECNYDISTNLPELISFIEKNNFETNLKNTGCKVDKLSLSLSNEFKDIVKLSEAEVINLEKDQSSLLNLSTNPILTRIKPNLLIQGFAAKTIQKQIRNITGNLIIKGNIGEEVKIDKSIPINAAVILFDKIELEHKSPMFIIILSFLLIGIVTVYLTTKYKFKFKVEK